MSALKTLDDSEKPAIVVFYSANAPISYLQQIEYPYITYIHFKPYPSSLLLRKANSAFFKITGVDVYKQFFYFRKIDCLYPYFEFMDDAFRSVKHKIHWLVDFNNRAFPQHYDDGGRGVTESQKRITSSAATVVLSSASLFEELKRYYPGYKCDVRILRFASSLSFDKPVELAPLLTKYGIDVPYMMSPNQFWEHKNQSIVLDAIHIIKSRRPDLRFKVLFTGSLAVNRGKGRYAEQLVDKLSELGLEEYILFLGVMERAEQLVLMKNAVSLVQPSLYEGWSTLVEEAKALNQFIILSDIPVHREQIEKNVSFFDPFDAEMLAGIMIKQLECPEALSAYNYTENIEEFGRKIIDVLRP